MKYFLVTALLLLINLGVYSQSSTKYYFDQDLKIVPESHALFFGTGIMDDSLYQLSCYNKANNSLIFIAHFKDSSLQVFQGMFRSFYPNGAIENEGVYEMGKENGLWKKRNIDGSLKDSSVYDTGKVTMSTSFSYYENLQVQSKILNDFANTKFRRTVYDMSGKVISEDTTAEDEDKVFTKVEIEASFPGGPNAWQRYVTKQIMEHADQFDDTDYGTCLIRFIVDIDGKVKDVTAITMVHSRLAEIMVNAIATGPRWTPAQVKGSYVKAFRIQPVTFTTFK
jgi:hypothetical protein